MFSLYLLGIHSDLDQASWVSYIVSCGASISEELFFRGFLFQLILQLTNEPMIALVTTAALSGITHFPLGSTKAGMEALLGGAYGFTYIYSGYNLAVPIGIHGLYDCGVILVTWIIAVTSLRKEIRQIKESEPLESTIDDYNQCL